VQFRVHRSCPFSASCVSKDKKVVQAASRSVSQQWSDHRIRKWSIVSLNILISLLACYSRVHLFCSQLVCLLVSCHVFSFLNSASVYGEWRSEQVKNPPVRNKLQWNLDNSNCRGPPKSLSYEKFELRVKRSLCFSHMWENNEIKLVTQECKHIQPQKRLFDGTNHSLLVRVMTKSSRYAQRTIITQTGTMKLGLS